MTDTQVKAKPVIRLDRSKPFSTAHGECVPQDPQYLVRYWQGGLIRGKRVGLPFDTNGNLIEDDGRDKPFQDVGILPDGKSGMVTYHPLYSPLMREFLNAKLAKMSALASVKTPEIDEGDKPEAEDDLDGAPEDHIDLAAWLRGEVQYEYRIVREAVKKRFGKNHPSKQELVPDLVLDEKVVPEDQVCDALKGYLKESKNAPVAA